MKYFLVHGQIDKVDPYVRALDKRGHVRTKDVKEADCVLCDFIRGAHRPLFQDAVNRHIPVYIYPHAALGMYMWDGLIANNSPVTCAFTLSEGQVQVLKRYGYPYQAVSAGWSYSKVLPFAPSPSVDRILFAPKHPNGNRALLEDDQRLNKLAFERLRSTGIPITVYYGHNLADNGIGTFKNVTYVPSKLTLGAAQEQIQEHSVVVAHDTFAYISIALGKPTLMFVGQQTPHANGRQALHYKDYRDIVKYPLDIIDWDNPCELLERAASTDKDIAEWKGRMIGIPFNGDRFVNKLEEIQQWAAWLSTK